MRLTITNNGPEPEAIAAPDGTGAQLLDPGAAVDIDTADVLIVGDKPDVREQFATAFQRLAATAKAIFDAMAKRKEQVQRQTGQAEMVDLLVANHGTNAVRAVLGDGRREATIQPGQSQAVSAKGYIELRELGTLDESQEDGGTQPALA